MSRVYNLLTTTVRPSVTQVKRRPQTRQRPFVRFVSARLPPTEITCSMCLNNSRKFRARLRFALGGTALFIRTSLERTGLWRPVLKLLSSSAGVTAAKLIDGLAVLTAGLLILEAGLMMLEAHGELRTSADAESQGSNESVASDPTVNMNFPSTRESRYDAHAPPISLAYLRSPLRPFGMPFLNFSSAYRDAVARALNSPRSPAGSEFGGGWSSFGSDSAFYAGSEPSGGDDGAAIVRAALAASLT